jgi:hypothetical protein|tara:strand:+ start:257 stop:415 length:159 start_codon:yes stop_codon:yes gene_type:complete
MNILEKLIELVKEYPNDYQLGENVRQFVYEQIETGDDKFSKKCEQMRLFGDK